MNLQKKQEKPRIYGIDLFRCIAILGVVILHTNGTPVDGLELWLKIREVSTFAVPYFLAISFFFIAQKIYKDIHSLQLQKRLKRILIPYIFWSTVYFSFNFCLYAYQGNFHFFEVEFLHEPIKLFFLGGASFHLWFLPLLFTGTILMKLGESILMRFSVIHLASCFLVASFAYFLLDYTGNNFVLGENIAFSSLQPLLKVEGSYSYFLRLASVYSSWTIRCAPYIFFSTLMAKIYISGGLRKLDVRFTVLLWFLFFIIHYFGSTLFPSSISEVLRGCITLVTALFVPVNQVKNSFLLSLSDSAYGIYFVHWVITVVLFFILNKLLPDMFIAPLASQLMSISILILGISWFCVLQLSKLKIFRFLALGYG